jgi:hypothetical protein
MFAIAVWLVCSVAVGWVAKACGRSPAVWLLFSLILSPSLGLIFVAVLSERKRPEASAHPSAAMANVCSE